MYGKHKMLLLRHTFLYGRGKIEFSSNIFGSQICVILMDIIMYRECGISFADGCIFPVRFEFVDAYVYNHIIFSHSCLLILCYCSR